MKQMEAFFQVLAFLGTVLLLGGAAVTILAIGLIGERRLSNGVTAASAWVFRGRGLSGKLAAAALVLAAGYAAVLLGASFASHEWTLGPGEEKYFCEVDCHLAYSVTSVATAKTLESATGQKTAVGMFYIVTVRTRFDEKTISPHRGNAPLEPAPRVITIVDDQGRQYAISSEGQQALELTLGNWTPPTQPLRPGESYTTQLVFDLPAGANNPRLLITSPVNPAWLASVLIGEENSLFHKKVFLRLASRPEISREYISSAGMEK